MKNCGIAGILLAALAVAAEPVEFRLVDGTGSPVDWGQRDVLFRYMGGLRAPAFTTDVPPGRMLLLGMFLLNNENGILRGLTDGVSVAGRTVTVNVQPVTDALFCSRNLTWADGKLYVAEDESLDGTSRHVLVFDDPRRPGRRLDTVKAPRALAVSGTTLFVIGDAELAAFDLKTHARQFSLPIDYGKGVGQMAMAGDRLFVGDRLASCVRILDAASGKELGQFGGEGEEKLAAGSDYAGIGVATTPKQTLVVCDAKAVREFGTDGKFIRKVASLNNGMALAVDAAGNIAVAVVRAADTDYGYTPEVWKLDSNGRPLLRLVRVYMSGPQPVPGYRLDYFRGMTGKLATPGGVAFDERGNLYVSDSNRWLKGQGGEFYPPVAYSDGGVVRITPAGDIDARLGSRYSAALIESRLEARAKRAPLARTRAALDAKRGLHLLAWGDSITQTGKDWNGGATQTANNWVHVLGRLLEQRCPGLKVQAEANGVGGQNAAEGHTRDPVPRVYEQPDLILLEFGTNDAAFHHYSPRRYAQALREMIHELWVLTDSDIVILTVGPLLSQNKEASEEEYVQAAVALGKELNVPVVNIRDAMARKLAESGGVPFETYHVGATNVHPNDAGHVLWAEAVAEVLTAGAPPP